MKPSSRTGRTSKPPHGYSDAFLNRAAESSQVRQKNGRPSAQTPLVSRKSPQLFLRYGTLLKCEALLVRKNGRCAVQKRVKSTVMREKERDGLAVNARFAMWATEKKLPCARKRKKFLHFFSENAFANKTFFVDLQHQASK